MMLVSKYYTVSIQLSLLICMALLNRMSPIIVRQSCILHTSFDRGLS
uniref:Uncharacterized protein n=1 Tax=Rhizophora mucronata TaxID=61149 RepID=A0A2P2LTW7_RHIMU